MVSNARLSLKINGKKASVISILCIIIIIAICLMLGVVLENRWLMLSSPWKSKTIITLLPPPPLASSSSAKDVEMLTCLCRVLWEELPIARAGETPRNKVHENPCPHHDVVHAHHGNAWHWKLWNQAVASRMAPSSLTPWMTMMNEINNTSNTSNTTNHHNRSRCSVWEVGAHVAAQDSRELMNRYGNCHYHAFEPIPAFYEQLQQRWAGEPRMTIHGYGLAKDKSTFVVSESLLRGESTYIADSHASAANKVNGADTTTNAPAATSSDGGRHSTVVAQLRSFDQVLSEIDSGIPTLLHMNCEGCEYDFLPQAKEHGFLEQVPIIQIAWHNYGKVGVGPRAWQLCEIRVMLMETHVMETGLAFGWDRWTLKT